VDGAAFLRWLLDEDNLDDFKRRAVTDFTAEIGSLTPEEIRAKFLKGEQEHGKFDESVLQRMDAFGERHEETIDYLVYTGVLCAQAREE